MQIIINNNENILSSITAISDLKKYMHMYNGDKMLLPICHCSHDMVAFGRIAPMEEFQNSVFCISFSV